MQIINNMITTIIFDLSEVYLKGAMGAGKHLRKRKGVDITDSHLLLPELNRLFLGKISEETYWQIVIEKNSWNISIDELKKAVRKNFKEIKGTREIIKKLRQNGYKLGLLSNHAKEWVMYCETNYRYHNLFHTVVYSYEAEFSKPSLGIFFFIIKKLGVDPKECLFIDDYIINIQAARKLGFKTIHFTSPQNLKEKLSKFKIRL